ncbi:MAG TPA: carboxypeptidase-like regulatory domain-containing protein, partial [Steroidobacteraceae bacterium]|nr:carboxypeptidase-like regulatory domain-containing protein [Steroidobacteraceae bacterium]
MHRYIRNSAIAAAAGLALMATLGASRVIILKPKSVEAVATIEVSPPDKSGKTIAIPDAKVSLLDGTGTSVATSSSDINGQFRITAPAAGIYSLCWDIQGRQTCKREVSLTEPTNYLGKLRTTFKDVQLYGQVLTGDGRACWVRDPFFKLSVFTNVDATDAANNPVAPTIRANTHGEYFFLLKSAGSYNITARCEKSKQNGSVSIRTVGVLDLNFKNHAPRIDEIAERASGKGVVSVLPNTAVQLTANAKDIDGDAVEYLWRDDDGVIPTPSPNPNQLTRNAPAVDGLHTTYLMARDGYGGYTYRRFNLEVGK